MGERAQATRPEPGIDWLVQAATRMLRPIVRFCVGRISCSAVIDLIREMYVHEARQYLAEKRPNQRVTKSAIALLCGMDGRAIENFESTGNRTYQSADICSEGMILGTWASDPLFREDGKPADLLIHGPGKTFARLVNKAAGRHVTPNTALERLVDSGNVVVVDNTTVQLVDPIYMPVNPSEQTAIDAGSHAINRLGATVLHNAPGNCSKDQRWLQQDRWSTRVPRDMLETARRELRLLLEQQIIEAEHVMERYETDDQENDSVSVGVGWYYWQGESESN